MPSRRQLIVEAFAELLRVIQVNDGYQTNAGQAVYLGQVPALGEPTDPEVALAIVVYDTVPQPNRFEILPIEVQGVAKASLDAPHLAAEQALADVCLAVEREDLTLGGLVKRMDVGVTRTLSREDGSTTVGFGVTYLLTCVREWGKP